MCSQRLPNAAVRLAFYRKTVRVIAVCGSAPMPICAAKQKRNRFQLRYILLKGLLNRIDYCASAGRKTADEPLVGPDISACTRTAMENSGYTLRPVQDYLASHAGENLIIEASTGIGKTEGALLWLGGRKGFYMLPRLKSASMQFIPASAMKRALLSRTPLCCMAMPAPIIYRRTARRAICAGRLPVYLPARLQFAQ